ncbi:putative (S)-2-hydroxy-acid oxidase [Helianthus annuus]|nr:putative (S)-2-hydroxy-acid oxidase [Helianthus annuus]KAJ0523458.1 putative (S)-2-hydroxy-acid oxidase [Helianthus annuus]
MQKKTRRNCVNLVVSVSTRDVLGFMCEILTAKAAAACNVIMGLSFSSTCTIEEVASSCNAVRFFQLYVYKRRDISALMVKRAEANGFKAILLTVDTPKMGHREADIKNK